MPQFVFLNVLVNVGSWPFHALLFILTSWIPTCAKAFLDLKDRWAQLVPQNDTDSTELVQQFFACVAALMSNQLRGMVINSLADFLEFFEIHNVCELSLYVLEFFYSHFPFLSALL